LGNRCRAEIGGYLAATATVPARIDLADEDANTIRGPERVKGDSGTIALMGVGAGQRSYGAGYRQPTGNIFTGTD